MDAPIHRSSHVVRELEALWSAVRRHHPDVPDVVLVLGTAAGGRSTITLGHFWPARWTTADGKRPEVVLAAELLHDLEQLLMVVIHEAVHGVASTRKIKDTSRDGSYHNKHYAALAEELGLEVRKSQKFGVETFLTPQLRELYADELLRLRSAHERASLARRDWRRGGGGDQGEGEGGEGGEGEGEGGQGGGEPSPTRGRRLALVCGCETPRKVLIAVKGLEAGPIRCGVCGEDFAPVKPEP